jgi:hypothetical protein
MDVTALTFSDASFDAAVSTFLFYVLPDELQVPALRELSRAAKPGGVADLRRRGMGDDNRTAGVATHSSARPLRHPAIWRRRHRFTGVAAGGGVTRLDRRRRGTDTCGVDLVGPAGAPIPSPAIGRHRLGSQRCVRLVCDRRFVRSLRLCAPSARTVLRHARCTPDTILRATTRAGAPIRHGNGSRCRAWSTSGGLECRRFAVGGIRRHAGNAPPFGGRLPHEVRRDLRRRLHDWPGAVSWIGAGAQLGLLDWENIPGCAAWNRGAAGRRPRLAIRLVALLVSRVTRGLSGETLNGFGAGEGNRTLVCSLGSCRSTIELHPRPVRRPDIKRAGGSAQSADRSCYDRRLTTASPASKETASRDTTASRLFGCSSAVEQSAVNRSVVGSNPTARAIVFSVQAR